MLDPIIAFFERVFRAIGRGLGLLVAWLVWPFLAAHGWYQRRNWLIKAPILVVLLVVIGFYGQFFWRTQFWYHFDPEFVQAYKFSERTTPAGQPVAATPGKCQPSGIVSVAADLTDANVNQNIWISSTLIYKLGFFGIDWDHTPFFDNKASFQRA